MQIHGKDWMLEVSEQDLVRMAMNALRRQDEKITVQAVASVSGLSVPQVLETMHQMAAEHERAAKEQ